MERIPTQTAKPVNMAALELCVAYSTAIPAKTPEEIRVTKEK